MKTIALFTILILLLMASILPQPQQVQAVTGDPVAFAANQLGSKLLRIWGYIGGQWLLYDPATPTTNTLQRLEVGKGYWIGVSSDAVIYYNVDPFYTNLHEGWNLIGWLGGATAVAAAEIAYTTGEDAASDNLGNQWVGQVFTANEDATLESVSLKLMRRGTSVGAIPFYLATVTDGTPRLVIARVLFDAGVAATAFPGAWYTIPMVGALEAGQQYAVYFGTSEKVPDVANFFAWIVDKSDPTYTGGHVVSSVDGGVSWVKRVDMDAMFKVNAKVI